MPTKVYSFKVFDINDNQNIVSDYFATEDAIKLFNGEIFDKSIFYFVNLDDLDGNGRIHKTQLKKLLSQ
jgi:hypothetical protein